MYFQFANLQIHCVVYIVSHGCCSSNNIHLVIRSTTIYSTFSVKISKYFVTVDCSEE